jgi:SAM-dependent methyltransferase
MEPASTSISDSGPLAFQRRRRRHWDGLCDRRQRADRPARHYHRYIRDYYRFLVPPGLRVLEIGCGTGDLLAAVEPSLGVGLDFSIPTVRTAARRHPNLHFAAADAHTLGLRGSFDVIVLSDLINDAWDVQAVFEQLKSVCTSRTRLILNFFNEPWRLPLALVKRLGLGADHLEQSWLAPQDVANLLHLAGFEVVNHFPRILLPLAIPLVSQALNRYAVHLWPFTQLALTHLMVARPAFIAGKRASDPRAGVSIIVPSRNEAGNIEAILSRTPALGDDHEIIFVEGHSSDGTFEAIQEAIQRHPERPLRLFRQPGRGKGDAVRLGFEEARHEVLMILDADMTVPPEDLARFYQAVVEGKGEFINGVRLVYPLENESMRFLNMLGNKFFSLAFSWLLGQPIKDTLCGTKVLWKRDYQLIADNRGYFGDFDPFGDFDLLFGAAKLNLKIAEIPVRYRSRQYGKTNISRWRHGWMLLKMVAFAARRIKFI